MNRIIRIFTLCIWAHILMFAATPAVAGQLHLVLNGKSFHVDSDYDWNENNVGVGIEYQFDSRSRWIKIAMAGGFRDSRNDMSYMAGAGLHRRIFATDRFAEAYVNIGVNVFMMTRKDINDHRPFPGALPSLTLGNRYGGINLSYVPKKVVHDFAKANYADPDIDGVFFLQLKIRLDELLHR